MGLGMSHSSNDDELFQRLTTLSNQLESARRAISIELVASAHRHRVKSFRGRADRDRLFP
jgi:hypothetical protein